MASYLTACTEDLLTEEVQTKSSHHIRVAKMSPAGRFTDLQFTNCMDVYSSGACVCVCLRACVRACVRACTYATNIDFRFHAVPWSQRASGYRICDEERFENGTADALQ